MSLDTNVHTFKHGSCQRTLIAQAVLILPPATRTPQRHRAILPGGGYKGFYRLAIL